MPRERLELVQRFQAPFASWEVVSRWHLPIIVLGSRLRNSFGDGPQLGLKRASGGDIPYG